MTDAASSSNAEELEQDLLFVMEECVRFMKLKPGDLSSADPNDLLCMLPHHQSEWGSLICGRAAYARLRKITANALSSSAFANRVNPEEVFKAFKPIFVDRWLRHPHDIEAKEVSQALHCAVEEAARHCRTRTHFLPCDLMQPDGCEEFFVGPVRFVEAQKFLAEKNAELVDLNRSLAGDVSEDAAKPSKKRKGKSGGHDWEKDVRGHFAGFSWVAEVRVEGCDQHTSRIKAGRAVEAGVDFLHLLIGRTHSHRMRIGGAQAVVDRRVELSAVDGHLTVALSVHGRRHSLGKEWWAAFNDPYFAKLTACVGSAIDALIQPTPLPHLSRRLLDAITWFGDAIRETSDAARVVKFMTAMEVLILTGEQRGMSRLLRDRIAALCFAPKEGNFDVLREDVKRAYRLRSRVVHGAASPSDTEMRSGGWTCERLAKDLIRMWIERYGHGVTRSDIGVKELKAHYDGFVAEVTAFLATAPAASTASTS